MAIVTFSPLISELAGKIGSVIIEPSEGSHRVKSVYSRYGGGGYVSDYKWGGGSLRGEFLNRHP
jgi:hypothetical protein